MSYTTITDLRKRISEERLIQLTDFSKAGVVDSNLVTERLASASGLIDSYCRGRYTLPLTASDQVKDLELVIAIYKLYEGRQQMPDQIRTSYEDAIAFLKDVSAGRASLDQATAAQSSVLDVKTKDHSTDPDAFDDTRLADFIG